MKMPTRLRATMPNTTATTIIVVLSASSGFGITEREGRKGRGRDGERRRKRGEREGGEKAATSTRCHESLTDILTFRFTVIEAGDILYGEMVGVTPTRTPTRTPTHTHTHAHTHTHTHTHTNTHTPGNTNTHNVPHCCRV